MSFQLRHYVEEDILVIEVKGSLGLQESSRLMLEQARALVREIGMRCVLFDMRNVSDRLAMGDAFYFVRSMPPVEKFIRSALLEPPECHDYGLFFEATARNAGHGLRVFYDRATALNWLRCAE